MKNLNNTGVTLLEILLASVIFVVTVAGVFAALSMVRAPVAGKEGALTAAVFGKQVLEALRSTVSEEPQAYFYTCSVNQNPCPDFALSVGQHQVSAVTLSSFGLSWPSAALSSANGNVLSYTVSCADGSNPCGSDTAHKVVLNISW